MRSPTSFSFLWDFSLGSTFNRRGAKLPRLLLLKPAVLQLDIANLVVLATVGEEVDPVLEALVHLLVGLDQLVDLHLRDLGLGVVGLDLWVRDGQEHDLDAAHVRGAVVGEAARDVGARGIHARKVVVGAAGPVDVAAVADVVDGVVDGDVDGLLGVLAVKAGELLWGQIERTSLEKRIC